MSEFLDHMTAVDIELFERAAKEQDKNTHASQEEWDKLLGENGGGK